MTAEDLRLRSLWDDKVYQQVTSKDQHTRDGNLAGSKYDWLDADGTTTVPVHSACTSRLFF